MNNKISLIKLVSLAEFVEKAKGDLENFQLFWQRKQEKSPKQYPDTLLSGDWDEQLIFFLADKMGIDATNLFNALN
jgi:hypothetical protein